MSLNIPRRTYADLYGPTTGDRVRLADTELLIEVEKDFTVYGDEVTFGGGKVIRDGMGQSSRATREATNGALDLVITNALIIDYWGIVKGDIGIKDGRIVKVGKAGNPDTMEGVDPELVIGASTEVIAGENMLVTAGGLHRPIPFSAPQQIYAAISRGLPPMIRPPTAPATPHDPTLECGRGRRRPLGRYHWHRLFPQHPALLNQSHQAIHRQHDCRAAGYAHGVPPFESAGAGGCSLRGEPNSPRDDCCRRYPA